MKLSELTEDQKGHLAWRLDHKTGTGYITACCIARGEHGNPELVEIFKQAGMTEHAAKIHARKVINYKIQDMMKPCPFCGAGNLLLMDDPQVSEWAITCAKCDVTMESTISREVLIHRWNNRVE
ncbi:MAG: Lar family restriction alleviation protein [Blastocatellia bacterium]